MNISNYTFYAPSQNIEIDVIEVYKTICNSFNSQIIKIFFFLFLIMILQKFIIPRSWDALRSLNNGLFKEPIDTIFNLYCEIVDSSILLGFAYIMLLFYTNGLYGKYLFMVNIIIGLFVFVIIFKLYFIIRDGGIKKSYIKTKEIIKRLKLK